VDGHLPKGGSVKVFHNGHDPEGQACRGSTRQKAITIYFTLILSSAKEKRGRIP
jgi:hypothetical protein